MGSRLISGGILFLCGRPPHFSLPKRFIARRGYPNTIISDNGTTFVGAANELEAFMNEWDNAKIESGLAQKKIVWKFNPPGESHFGEIWERLVQSCKKVMIGILGNQSLTDEILSTTMCLVEQTLNARRLTAVSDDPEDLTALTPNHFLLGRENASAPFMPSSERYHDLRKSFKTAQAYADMIWKKWTREYLQQWNQIGHSTTIEVVKRTCAKPERSRVSMASG